MFSQMYDMELRGIESMTRQQVLDALRGRLDCLPPELCERLEEQPDGWLRLLLMSARLTWALRMLRDQYRTEQAARGPG
jgi:hypothetical protein